MSHNVAFSAASNPCGSAVSPGAVSLRARISWLGRFPGKIPNYLRIFDSGQSSELKKNDCIDLYFYLSRLGFDEPGDGL